MDVRNEKLNTKDTMSVEGLIEFNYFDTNFES